MRGATSSRIQAASDSAIGQRSSATGVTATRRLPGISTALTSTMSRAPQAPGPMSCGRGTKSARRARRASQPVGSAARGTTRAVSGADGRGRGNGTAAASTAMPHSSRKAKNSLI